MKNLPEKYKSENIEQDEAPNVLLKITAENTDDLIKTAISRGFLSESSRWLIGQTKNREIIPPGEYYLIIYKGGLYRVTDPSLTPAPEQGAKYLVLKEILSYVLYGHGGSKANLPSAIKDNVIYKMLTSNL